MTTQLQTVDVQYPFSPLIFQTMERCPVAPPEIREAMKENDRPQGLKVGNKKYYWFPDGRTIVVEADGAFKTFWPRIGIKDAMTYGNNGCDCSGCKVSGGTGFFQFHKDGSQTAACFGKTYFWGKPEESIAIPFEGSEWLSPYGGYGHGWEFYYTDDDIDYYHDDYESDAASEYTWDSYDGCYRRC